MRDHPFITLIGCTKESRIEATQIPVLIEEKDGKIFIYGHVARKSDHEKALEQNPNVLALFTGEHVYVSGSWYSGNPRQASTWNYISVHARGAIKFLDEGGLAELLRKLSLHFENNNHESSTVFDNLPFDYREKLMKAIVAFELEVTEIDNVHKLSQNRDEKSYRTIREKLEKGGGDARIIAERMRQNESHLFKKK